MEWDADWEISASVVNELVARHVDAHSCVRFGEGWDNVAFLVDDTWVFRFPRRKVAVRLLETEIAVLPRLPELPIPIPRPVHVGEPSELFPHPYAGYRKLSGVTACRTQLDDATRSACAEPLARFLRTLHAAEPPVGLPADEFGRMDLERRFEQVRERFREVIDAGELATDAPWRRMLADAPVDYVTPATVVCHGDLYDRHLLLDQGALCGVIDWGDVHRGDAAVDLSVAHRFLPPAALERFREVYGSVPEPTWVAARFRALHHSVACLRYALDVGDRDLARASRWSMHTLAD